MLEKELIRRLLLPNSKTVINILDIVRPDMLQDRTAAAIYLIIIRLFETGAEINELAIVGVSRKDGTEITASQIFAYSDAQEIPGTDVELAARITEEWQVRQLQKLGIKLGTGTIRIEKAIDEIADIQQRTTGEQAKTIQQHVFETLQYLTEIKEAHDEGRQLPGVLRTGFFTLDNAGFFRRDDLIIIAARPGMGKTVVGLQAAINAAKNGTPVLFFSLEMGETQLISRVYSSEGEIDLTRILSGNFVHEEKRRILEISSEIEKLPIVIQTTSDFHEMIVAIKRFSLLHSGKTPLIIIDYLQLIHHSLHQRNREQEVAEISKALKGLAKNLHLCIVCIAQLSRACEIRGGDKKPILSDLRESGQLEQDADKVLFVYRPAYYGFDTDETGSATYIADKNGNKAITNAEIIVAKNRNGFTFTSQLLFAARYVKFVETNTLARMSTLVELEDNKFQKVKF